MRKNIPTVCKSPVACSRDAKSLSCGRRVVEAVPEDKGDRDSPEHESGRNSPRAQKVWQKTICLKRLEARYPKEVDPDKAEELRMTQLNLSAKIICDINLCGGATAPVQGTPSTSQLGAPSSSR